MTTAIIIQARLNSSRLPAKVLLPLPNRRRVVEEVVFRCDQVEQADAIVLAVPDHDAAIINRGMWWPPYPGRCRMTTGSEDDVLARYAKAAAEVNADTIVRITADCPMLSPEVVAQTIELHRSSGADYTSNCWPVREFPHGWDCEVFSRGALEMAHVSVIKDPWGLSNPDPREAFPDMDLVKQARHDREHVTPWMQRMTPPECRALLKSHEDRSHIRCTLDTLEDYRNIWEMMARELEASQSQ